MTSFNPPSKHALLCVSEVSAYIYLSLSCCQSYSMDIHAFDDPHGDISFVNEAVSFQHAPWLVSLVGFSQRNKTEAANMAIVRHQKETIERVACNLGIARPQAIHPSPSSQSSSNLWRRVHARSIIRCPSIGLQKTPKRWMDLFTFVLKA